MQEIVDSRVAGVDGAGFWAQPSEGAKKAIKGRRLGIGVWQRALSLPD